MTQQPAEWIDSEDDKPKDRRDLSRLLETWNETSGALPRGGSWFVEVLGMLEDAYDLGAHQAGIADPVLSDAWRDGAKFALEAVSKVDSMCWLTDNMKVVCIKLATDAVIAERDNRRMGKESR